jgi:hypothetical protein
MKKYSVKKITFAGLLGLLLPAAGFAASDEAEIVAQAEDAVTAAIASANAEGGSTEGLRSTYITDAVCGAFKAALDASYKQTTAAWKTVEGGMKAALASGVEPSLAATVVSRGIDACLEEKLEYKVWMFVQHGLNMGLAGTGVSYSYIAPTSAYMSPAGLGTGIFRYPVFENNVCVENCESEPPGPPEPPEPPVPGPSPSPSTCVSNCI